MEIAQVETKPEILVVYGFFPEFRSIAYYSIRLAVDCYAIPHTVLRDCWASFER